MSNSSWDLHTFRIKFNVGYISATSFTLTDTTRNLQTKKTRFLRDIRLGFLSSETHIFLDFFFLSNIFIIIFRQTVVSEYKYMCVCIYIYIFFLFYWPSTRSISPVRAESCVEIDMFITLFYLFV